MRRAENAPGSRPRGTNGVTCSLKLHSNYGSVEAADGEALHRPAPTFGRSRRDKTHLLETC
jgi:hypothetical protein